jgi:hypothetical protein
LFQRDRLFRPPLGDCCQVVQVFQQFLVSLERNIYNELLTC